MSSGFWLAVTGVLQLCVEAGQEEVLPGPEHEAVLAGLHDLQMVPGIPGPGHSHRTTETPVLLIPPSRFLHSAWEDLSRNIPRDLLIWTCCICWSRYG